MAILNVTYRGRSADVRQQIDDRTGDAEIRRICVRLIRTGELGDLYVRDLPDDAFVHFVIDRFADPDGVTRVYLRPKVPFGSTA
jgi:hypothetical protein